jgi:hypothetical protein
MGRGLRAEVFDRNEVGIVHCIQRCVRWAFLAGQDSATGRSFEHRREWIRRRLELLSAVFGIEVLGYAVMSNHLHVILRTRPDVIRTLSDKEIATRWLQIFPGRRSEEYLGTPTPEAISALASNSLLISELRLRLSDISWFMRSLAEPVARLANREDECTGRFWEGRFKAVKIMDEAGLLACAMYIDMNPIRASLARSPGDASFTSAFDRMGAKRGTKKVPAASETPGIAPGNAGGVPKRGGPSDFTVWPSSGDSSSSQPLSSGQGVFSRQRSRSADCGGTVIGEINRNLVACDAWLASLTLDDKATTKVELSRSRLRASDQGFLPMELDDYLKLLEWTCRRKRLPETRKVPARFGQLLARVGIEADRWLDLVWDFKRVFGRSKAAGNPTSLRNEAIRRGKSWYQGQSKVAAYFLPASG